MKYNILFSCWFKTQKGLHKTKNRLHNQLIDTHLTKMTDEIVEQCYSVDMKLVFRGHILIIINYVIIT